MLSGLVVCDDRAQTEIPRWSVAIRSQLRSVVVSVGALTI